MKCLEKEAKIADDYLIKLSNHQAVILNRQWKKVNLFRKHSNEISHYYFNNLKNKMGIIPCPIRDNMLVNLIRYPLLVDNRNELVDIFRKNRVELGLWFTAPISSPQINHEIFYYEKGSCPIAENISEKICNLPIHYKVNIRDAERIVNLLT